MPKISRLSISVPPELASDLNYVHRRLSVSKSALVTSLLQDGLRDFRMLLESLPESPADEDIIRFRGASAEMVLARIASLSGDLANSRSQEGEG